MLIISLISQIFILSHGFNIFFSFIVLYITLKRYFQTKIKLILVVSGLMIAWLFTNLMLIIPTLIPSLQLSVISGVLIIDFIAVFNVVGSALVVSLFIFFIDNFEGQISPTKTAISFGLTLVAFFLAVAGIGKIFVPTLNSDVSLTATIVGVNDLGSCTIGTGDCLTTLRWSPIPSMILFPVVILAGIWTILALSKSIKYVYSMEQLRQIKFMRLGTIFAFFVGPGFGLLGVILVDFLEEPVLGTYASEIIGYLFVSAGVFLIGLSYISSKRVAFLLPQRIDALLVINNAGLPLYQFEFRNKAIEGETSLVSGAITAITALMKEAFGVTTDVEKIQFQDRELLLHFQSDVAFILITERSSTYLKNALDRFSEMFISRFKDYLEFIGDLDKFEDAESDLLRAFGLESIEIKHN